MPRTDWSDLRRFGRHDDGRNGLAR